MDGGKWRIEQKEGKAHGYGQQCDDCQWEDRWGVWNGVERINGDGQRLDLGSEYTIYTIQFTDDGL